MRPSAWAGATFLGILLVGMPFLLDGVETKHRSIGPFVEHHHMTLLGGFTVMWGAVIMATLFCVGMFGFFDWLTRADRRHDEKRRS